MVQELTPEEQLNAIYELIEDVHYHYRCMVSTTRLDNQAHHLIELSNKVSDLSTWHPGFDGRTGTLPWEREDEEQG